VSKDSAKREEMKKNLLLVCCSFCSWRWRRSWGQLVLEPRLAGQPSSLPSALLALFLLLMTRGWKWRANDRNWSNACDFLFYLLVFWDQGRARNTDPCFLRSPFLPPFFLVSDLQGAIEKTVMLIVGFLGFMFVFVSVFALCIFPLFFGFLFFCSSVFFVLFSSPLFCDSFSFYKTKIGGNGRLPKCRVTDPLSTFNDET
jgi:hypothetical protein